MYLCNLMAPPAGGLEFAPHLEINLMFGRQMVSALSLTDNLLCAFWPHRLGYRSIPFHQLFGSSYKRFFSKVRRRYSIMLTSSDMHQN